MLKQPHYQSQSNQAIAKSAIHFDYETLAQIYNKTRTDYIVPMPMNAKGLIQYVAHYDIDLEASIVVMDSENKPLGLGMLGRRDHRAWITRLGLVPQGRGKGLGNLMMDTLFQNARERGDTESQLEVIKDNDPAHHLFIKYGFTPTRELLIIRRPINPNFTYQPDEDVQFTKLDTDTIERYLHQQRADTPSWIEETPSIINAGNLEGYQMNDDSGASAWIIFQNNPFKINHIVMGHSHDKKFLSGRIMKSLLSYIHQLYPMKDTIVENVPPNDPSWVSYQDLSYIETFRRIEMVCTL